MSILHDLNVERHEGTLNNGIRVVLLCRKGAPVAVSAILNSGSQYDPAGTPGMAHFIEHMITNGSARFPSKDVLAEHIESVGGGFGAKTGQEFLVVDTEVSEKEDFDRIVDIFDATLCNPLMDRKVFENEKNIVIKEIQKGLSNPAQLQVKIGRELFLKGTILEHNVIGDEATIGAISYEDMIESHSTLFDASRILFVASGDISMEEMVQQLNTLTFKEGKRFSPVHVERKDSDQQSAAVFFDTKQTHFIFGVPSAVTGTEDMGTLSLLGAILAGGRSSRLARRLRYGKGLIYSVGPRRLGTHETAQWGITTDTSQDKMQEVIDEIILEIKDLQQQGVKESELEFVKNSSIKSLRRHTQTSADLIDYFGYYESFSGKAYDIDAHIEQVKRTTVADIKRVIDTYLKPELWQLAMVGRTKPEDIVFNW